MAIIAQRAREPEGQWNALPRMEAHILDGPHFLLETHPDECVALMSRFIARVESHRSESV